MKDQATNNEAGGQEQEESSLDRLGPYVIWIGLTLIMALTVFIMVDANLELYEKAPTVAAGPPMAVATTTH